MTMTFADVTCLTGDGEPASVLAPQSSDQGQTIKWVAVCDGHAIGWWDGADWAASGLIVSLTADRETDR